LNLERSDASIFRSRPTEVSFHTASADSSHPLAYYVRLLQVLKAPLANGMSPRVAVSTVRDGRGGNNREDGGPQSLSLIDINSNSLLQRPSHTPRS
jgi:hypothetical protein